MFDDLNDLYQQVILDHCKQPRNFHEMPAATCSAQGFNPLCGDNLKLFLTLAGNVTGDVGKLAVFAGVHKYPARVKCAILSWHALIGALKGEAKPVSTESE